MDITDTQLDTLVSRYLDGELSEHDQADLYRRFMRDPGLRQRFDEQVALEREIGIALREEIDASRIEPMPAKRSPLPWAQIFATAAALMLAVGLWSFVHSGSAQSVSQQGAEVDRVVSLEQIEPWWRTDDSSEAFAALPVAIDSAASDLSLAGQTLVGVLDRTANRVIFYEVGTHTSIKTGWLSEL